MEASSVNSPLMENLRQLFAECDSNKNGNLGRDEFSQLCNKIGLNMDVAAETFERLDIDKNGKITFDEFAAGFIQTCKQQQQASGSPKTNNTDQQAVTNNNNNNNNKPQVPSRFQQQSQKPTTSQDGPSRLAPSSRGRKSASPIGILSLGSTGSSGSCSNLASSSSASSSGINNRPLRSTSSHNQMLSNYSGTSGGDTVASSQLSGACGELASLSSVVADNGSRDVGVVVYSSDMVDGGGGGGGGDYYDQSASGSGQFNSLLSNGSYSQVKTMQDLLECVQKLQSENQQLSQIFFKEKRERDEYISQLGEEFDQQLKEVEERANRRAREELENEKKRLSEMMQTERETLQHHYQTLEKISNFVKTPNGKTTFGDDGETIDKVQSKLQDTFVENRQLKKSLLDTKTDVALIWKEMEKLKRQYEDKLSSAYEKHNETKSECDHIKQQLNLMKDSNRKLQDASDVISNYITDKVKPVITVATSDQDHGDGNFLIPGSIRLGGGASPSSSRRGSILSEYLNNSNDNESNNQSNSTDDGTNASSNGDLESMASSQGGLRPTKNNIKPSTSNVINDKSSLSNATIDSDAHKSIRNKIESKIEQQQQQQQQTSSKVPTTTATSSGLRSLGRHFHLPGTKVSSFDNSEGNDNGSTAKTNSTTATQRQAELKSISSVDNGKANDSLIVEIEPADGLSKATFNIILVGDSFVGKSSFATRFMEGNFVQGLISNCSIDFKTKAYKVDGTNYTINLWDTAGQERFRSITASYFRKADGIILMYDVTERRSYLNVRNWMSTISDTAAENVAVLLVGNKIDLRQKGDTNKHHCVPAEEGHRLANEYGIVFLETSVKTGTNLLPSMGQLIRLIAKNNFDENREEDKDRIKLNDKSKTFNCMPKNC